MVAQPQADQVAPAFGFGKVLEFGASVSKHAVVDEWICPGSRSKSADRFSSSKVDEGGKRRGALVVDRLALQRIAAADLVGAEAGAPRAAVKTGAAKTGASPGWNSRCRSNQNGR